MEQSALNTYKTFIRVTTKCNLKTFNQCILKNKVSFFKVLTSIRPALCNKYILDKSNWFSQDLVSMLGRPP